MPGAFGALGGPCGITKPVDALLPAQAVCVLKPFLKVRLRVLSKSKS